MSQEPLGQIVAMGGGGFSMEPENFLLDDFVLSLARRQPARVCFLPTASGDSAAYVTRFYRAFSGRCVPSDLTLTDSDLPRRPTRTDELADFVREQDVFYSGEAARCICSLFGVHTGWIDSCATRGSTERYSAVSAPA